MSANYEVRWRDGDKTAFMTTLMTRLTLTVEAEAKRRVPVRTGTLRRSITSAVENAGQRGRVGTNLRYAVAVHEGTKAHVILPRNKKALFWKGARHPVRKVRHPGTKGQPFLTDALKASRTSLDTIVKYAVASWLGEGLR